METDRREGEDSGARRLTGLRRNVARLTAGGQ